MKNIILLALAFGLIAVSGCKVSPQKNERNIQTAREWLSGKAGHADIDISGYWEDLAVGSWGNPEFAQNGNKVVGTMGSYNVEGVVNGKRIYLIALYDGYLYYTIIMDSLNANKIRGKSVDQLSVDEDFKGERFILKKVADEDDSSGVNRAQ